MTRDEAIERIQKFLDKSSHHKWKEVQEAIDFLKTDKPYVESNYKTWEKAWHKGYDAGIEQNEKYNKILSY